MSDVRVALGERARSEYLRTRLMLPDPVPGLWTVVANDGQEDEVDGVTGVFRAALVEAERLIQFGPVVVEHDLTDVRFTARDAIDHMVLFDALGFPISPASAARLVLHDPDLDLSDARWTVRRSGRGGVAFYEYETAAMLDCAGRGSGYVVEETQVG